MNLICLRFCLISKIFSLLVTIIRTILFLILQVMIVLLELKHFLYKFMIHLSLSFEGLLVIIDHFCHLTFNFRRVPLRHCKG